MTQTTSAESLKSFFAAFGQGDLEGVIATFHPGAHIQAVRGSTRRPGEVYGTYAGRAGAREFITNLGATFDTQAFEVKRLGGDGDLAFAEGSFVHRVKASGKLFRSDWSLVCVIEDGKIREYRFYEDSAALAQAQ